MQIYTPKCTHVPIFTTIGPTDFPGSRGRTYGRTSHTVHAIRVASYRSCTKNERSEIGKAQCMINSSIMVSSAGMYNSRPAKTFHLAHRERKLLWGRQLLENNIASNIPAGSITLNKFAEEITTQTYLIFLWPTSQKVVHAWSS